MFCFKTGFWMHSIDLKFRDLPASVFYVLELNVCVITTQEAFSLLGWNITLHELLFQISSQPHIPNKNLICLHCIVIFFKSWCCVPCQHRQCKVQMLYVQSQDFSEVQWCTMGKALQKHLRLTVYLAWSNLWSLLRKFLLMLHSLWLHIQLLT